MGRSGGDSHDSARTAITAHAIPAMARAPIVSPRNNTAIGTLTSGYKLASGVMTEAFPSVYAFTTA